MNEHEFRVLDALVRNPDGRMSINELDRWVSRRYNLRKAYKNTRHTVLRLRLENVLSTKSRGKSTMTGLNFGSPLLAGELAIFEIEKKRRFLTANPDFNGVLWELEKKLDAVADFAILSDPERSRITGSWDALLAVRDESAADRVVGNFEKMHNIRINQLVLMPREFESSMTSEEGNPAKAFLAGERMVLLNPERFWRTVCSMKERGLEIKLENLPNPTKLKDEAILANMSIFGYPLRSPSAKKPSEAGLEKIALESLIAAIVFKGGDARLIEAIPILLAKNPVNQRYLFFMAKKYGMINKVGFLLEASEELIVSDRRKIMEIGRALMKYRKLKSDEEEYLTAGSKRGGWSLPRKWNIVTNMSLEDLKEKAEIYNVA